MKKVFGWTGVFLKIDLSKNQAIAEQYDQALALNFLGGRGFAIKLLWDTIKQGTDPLSPENKLIFATGPLTAIGLPNSGKLVVASKSPLTGGYGDGNIGTLAAVQMRKAGYDIIILEGKAEKPVIVKIKDKVTEFVDGSGFWGLSSFQTEEKLRTIAPYNVYRAKDGHVAILCVLESHWTNLLTAMGREDLKTDPRFVGNAARVENLAATDEVVESWTQTLSKHDIFAITKRHRVPSAPVRNLFEVMHDPHLHQRGMLEWIDHPDLGRIVVPGSPLRFHEAGSIETTPSPRAGQHNVEIYGSWLGLSGEEIDKLREDGVI